MRHFEEMLQELLQRVVVMGSIVESMIESAVRSLIERNEIAGTTSAPEKEKEVNTLQVEIDDRPSS